MKEPKAAIDYNDPYSVTTTVVTRVFGHDVTIMSDSQLIDAIRKVEEQRAALLGITTKSEVIAKKVEALADAAMAIAAILDERAKQA